MDFEYDHKTLNIPYAKPMMWTFEQLYDKGLAY